MVPPDSTPKKLGLFWESRSSDVQRLEEELMTTRLKEMEATMELKELKLKVIIKFLLIFLSGIITSKSNFIYIGYFICLNYS